MNKTLKGKELRARRKALGLTLEEAGELCGVGYDTISRYELGGKNLRPTTFEKIEAALNSVTEEDVAALKGGYAEFDAEEQKVSKPREETRVRRISLMSSQVLSYVLESVHTGKFFEA